MRPLITLLLLVLIPCSVRSQTNPVVTVTASHPDGTLPVGEMVTFTAHAEDPDGTIQSIIMYRNGIQIGFTTATNANFTGTIQPFINDFYADAIDNSGNTSRSDTIRILGNTGPTIRIIEPTGTVTHYSLSNSVTIRVEASDSDGTVDHVNLLENGRLLASDYQAPYEFVYRPQTFGNFTLEVQAFDNHGLSASQTRSVQYVRINDDYNANVPANLGTNLTLRGNNTLATRQKGEPNHAGAAGGKSIWWAWRSSTTGTVTIDTIGSDFDTVLGVYTNQSLQFAPITNLVTAAASDDDPANAPLSKVKFTAEANRTYFIAVDGRDGFAGNIVLNIRQTQGRAPAHDFLASAFRTGPSGTLNSSNVGASKEIGEPDHAGNAGGASMWWRIDNAFGQPIRISTAGSNFDTLLAVYTNRNQLFIGRDVVPITPENLVLVAENDDGGGSTNRTSVVEFIPRSGVTYWIAVDGYNGAEGNIRLTLTVQQQNVRPANDQFVAATVLTGSSALTNVNTFLATTEFGEPQPVVAGKMSGKSVWYRWVAPATGPVYVSTKWSDFDTVLGVYAGTNITGLMPIASNDDDGGLATSALVFNAIAGQEYRIVVAGYQGAGGDMVIMLNQPPLLLPRMVTQVIGRVIALSVEDIGGTAILEGSSDLVNWTELRIINEADAALEIEPDPNTPQLFYRVRQLE